jgi:hypothetical protein
VTPNLLCRAAGDPRAWGRQIRRIFLGATRYILWKKLDTAFGRHLRLPSSSDGVTVLVDGLWDNPNHFFRVRLFLEGVAPEKRRQLAAILKTPNDRSLNTLEALGFTRFFFISDTPVTNADHEAANRALRGIRHHRDLLTIQLPGGLPADIFYDTALKLAKNPQPSLDSPIWVDCLADIFRLHRFYTKVFTAVDVGLVVLSHPWKNEFGAALWEGLSRKIPCFHLNAMYEVMRIRRFDSHDDFFIPIEAMAGADFVATPEAVQSAVAEAGLAYLEERATAGTNTDINQVMAYRNQQSGSELRRRFNIPATHPVILVCCHVWYDFPHSFGMRNFTDFCDWIEVVLSVAFNKDNVTWLIKPHPTESWYGGFRLSDLVVNPPDHVRVLPEDVSVSAALDIASVVVTVHGTVAVEATARGIPVLCADKGLYSDWGFSTTAISREDFLRWLDKVETLSVPDSSQISLSAAFAYLAVGPGEQETGLLRLPADHVSPWIIFGNLLSLVTAGGDVVSRQGELISYWLNSKTKSFAVFHKMRMHINKIGLIRNEAGCQ